MTSDTSAAGGPAGFQLFSEEVAANPYPLYEQLRREAPVTRFGPFGLWAISRYDDVVRVLRDPETFSSVVGIRELSGEETVPTMLFSDPPVHTRLRGLIAKAFTPRVVELQRPAIQAYCDRLIDRMLAQPEPDVVAELAAPLPVQVIANMLGVAGGDLATFKEWSDIIIENVATIVITGDLTGVEAIQEEFDGYFTGRIEQVRAKPEDNLLSELVRAETEEGRLTKDELLMFCRLLLVAGNETTTGLIVNAMRAFSEFPEAMERVRRNMDLLPGAIEEALRYYAPFQGTFRRATRDVELRGQTIRANERMLVLLASANRDEDVFDRPDEFDITREPNRHVSFGMGIHYCVGAPLARLEASIALATLLPRIRRVELADTEAGQLLRPGGPKSLRVRFELAA